MTPPRRRASGGRNQTPGVDFREVEPAPVVLLKGSEDYVAIRAIDRIKAMLRAQHSAVEFTRVDAATAATGELAMVTSPSLFGEPRLIIAEDLASMNDVFLEEALGYLRQPADEDVTLVLRHSGGNRGKKLLDQLTQQAVVVDCAPVKNDQDKLDFVRREFRGSSRTIHPDAARALVAAAGGSLSDLGGACQQLLRDVPGDITVDHVDRYFGGRVEVSAFKVADAAFEGRGEAALRLYRHALSTGVEPVVVTAALARKARQIAAVVDHRGSRDGLASTLGLPPWQLKQAVELSRRWSPRMAAAAVETVAQADAEVKGLSRAPEFAVERALASVASSLGR